MPVLQPAEIWKKTGRYEIEELFKLEDRKGRRARPGDDPRGGAHLPRRPDVRSYRELPLISTRSRPRSATSRGRAPGSCGPASSR